MVTPFQRRWIPLMIMMRSAACVTSFAEGCAREEPDVRRAREEAPEDGLPFRVEEDEAVVVDVHGDAA